VNIWIAIVLACNGPMAQNCTQLVKPEVFYDTIECQEDVQKMIAYLRNRGVYAKGACHVFKTGDSV